PPKVWLPPEGQPRQDYFLTRKDVADRIRAMRRNPHAKHLIRVILLGVYTGTRSKALRRLRWDRTPDHSWVDLAGDTIHRKGYADPDTNKRRPPCRIHDRLRPWLRRWREADMKAGVRYVIHYQGKPIGNVLRSWATAKKEAQFTGEDHGLHIMRHTAATWAMLQGLPVGQIAKYLGMDVKTVERHYGHHHPDYQQEVASFSGKQRRTA